ncbi:MAG: hypothetical protein JWO06_104 [Bacteroidota bacterium]|nr:hypothetical protein [Bacteroidota bacterium]
MLFGIFLLSVAVRLPQLNRPLSGHHEFCTAISLRVMQIWYDNGIEKYGYNPVMTYNNPADKNINNSANASGKMIDKEGNYYYVSHPPFAYYFPFFIFKILHIRPDVLPLQIINLIFHFICGLFVYFTVCLLSFNRARSLPYRSAVVAFSIYTFLPATLWFQGNVYMSDMAVHLPFVIGVYTALKMIIRQKFYSPKYIFIYALCLALMLYTSWLGVFFAFGIIVYSLLHVRSIKGFNVLIWTTVIVGLLMLRLITYQYSQINGPGAYVSEMINRYVQRGSLEETDRGLMHFMFSYLWLFKTLLYNYFIHYIVIYLILSLFIWFAMTHKKLKIVFSENGYRFIWLSVLPVGLLHFFFLNYSVHDFTVLYASLFFSVLLGILYDKIKKSGAVPIRNMRIGLIVTILLLILQYEVMNPPFNSFLGKKKSYQKEIGTHIKESVPKDAVVLTASEIDPQIVFYAGRNIKFVKDRDEALAFLASTGQNKGVGVTFSSKFNESVFFVTDHFPDDSLSKP